MLHPFLIVSAYNQGIRWCFPHRKREQRDAEHLFGGVPTRKRRAKKGMSLFSSLENAFYFQNTDLFPFMN